MRGGVDRRREVRDAELLETLGGETRSGDGEVKDLSDGRTYRALVALLGAQHHIIRYDTCLTVGRASEVVQPRLPRDRVRVLNGIPHRPNMGLGGL